MYELLARHGVESGAFEARSRRPKTVALAGSVALLGETLHNVADALTACGC